MSIKLIAKWLNILFTYIFTFSASRVQVLPLAFSVDAHLTAAWQLSCVEGWICSFHFSQLPENRIKLNLRYKKYNRT